MKLELNLQGKILWKYICIKFGAWELVSNEINYCLNTVNEKLAVISQFFHVHIYIHFYFHSKISLCKDKDSVTKITHKLL